MNFNDSWVEIFSAGSHVDSEGRPRVITAQFLEDVVRNYDPTLHESPAVIGHPADNAPAYGWPERLRVRGGKLEVKFKEVDPDFEQMVRDGRFKKRSASFYMDPQTAPGGRAPYLRHIGFLGAQPPAVKGLRDIQFNEGESLTFEATINFSEDETMDPNQEQSLVQKILDGLKAMLPGQGKKDGEAASFSEVDLEKKIADALKASTTTFSEALTRLETENKELRTLVTQHGSSATKQQIVAFTEKLGIAKFPPAFRNMGAVEFMEVLAGVDQKVTVVSFSETNGQRVETKTETPLLAWFQNFLTAQAPYIEFGERLGGVNPSGNDDVTGLDPKRQAELREMGGLPAKQGGQ